MSGGRNAPSSSTSITSRSVAPSGTAASAVTTQPVTRRVPSGTTTRAPFTGAGTPAGRLYVSRPRPGTGTATPTARESVGFGEKRTDRLHVFPHVALAFGTAQQIRRMEGGHELDAVAVVVEASAQPRDRR